MPLPFRELDYKARKENGFKGQKCIMLMNTVDSFQFSKRKKGVSAKFLMDVIFDGDGLETANFTGDK